MKKFVLIFPLLLIAAAVLALLFYIFNFKATPANQELTLKNLGEALQVTTDIRNYNYTDWLNENNEQLPLTGKLFWAGTSNIKDAVEGKKVGDNISLINSEFLDRYAIKTQKFFNENGFRQSAQNTFTYKQDVFVMRRLGFERGNMKCVVTLNQTTDPFGGFSCGTIDYKQIDLQKQLTPPFNLTYNPKAPLSFRVDMIKDNFSRGTASDPILGYVWFAKKTDGNWRVIWKGEEIPVCSQMKKLGVPKSIYDSCYAD